ncbi:hypothetical protein [uncultured Sphingomonas sp.]|uniref:hypothetical protein n=1 Tax=uncultured Sphingomonas sp. TaxID=158754 RepID=UPI0025D7B3A7|nr:hypothetical protein [uncultured Sphingomonas sp.]
MDLYRPHHGKQRRRADIFDRPRADPRVGETDQPPQLLEHPCRSPSASRFFSHSSATAANVSPAETLPACRRRRGDALVEQLPGIVSALPRLLERSVRLDAQGDGAAFAVISIVASPLATTDRLNAAVHAVHVLRHERFDSTDVCIGDA